MLVPAFDVSDDSIHSFLIFCSSYGLDYQAVLRGALLNFLKKFGDFV